MEALRNHVRDQEAKIVLQVVLSAAGLRQEGVRSLEAMFGEPRWPVAWIEFPHGDDKRVAVSQTYAVSAASVDSIEADGQIVGSLFESGHARFCLLGNVMPSNLSLPNPAQARQVLEKIDSVLRQVDMSFHNVVRTWLYADRILSWYDDFNRARNTFFADHGVSGRMVPASTGIGMSNPAGAALVANALAAQPKDQNTAIGEVRSPLQCPAPEYRSCFSRAVEVGMPDWRCLYVSGTASIDHTGATAHEGDIDRQIDLTMEVVRNILASRGMNWADVSRAVAYFRDLKDSSRLGHYISRKRIPAMPVAAVQADMCRESLLFELEADAMTHREARAAPVSGINEGEE